MMAKDKGVKFVRSEVSTMKELLKIVEKEEKGYCLMRRWKGWRWVYPCFTVRCGDAAFQKEKGCGVLSKSVLFGS